VVPASLGRRLVARMIDGLVLAVPAGVLLYALRQSLFVTRCADVGFAFAQCVQVRQGSASRLLLETWLLLFLLTALYEVIALSTAGATPGKWIMRLRVVDVTTGRPPAPGRALARYVTLCVTGSVFTIGWWSPILDGTGRRRGWHDAVGHDVVIRT
jgi:uncharacterized RDD family membrane protein YckC